MNTGVAFTALQYLYLETQVFVMRLNAVYGTSTCHFPSLWFG